MLEIHTKIAKIFMVSSPDIVIPTNEDQLKTFLAVDIEKLDLTSLDKVELIMEIENDFGTPLDEEAVMDCDTIGDLINLVLATKNNE